MNRTICTPSEYILPTELLSYNDFSVVPFLLYRAAPAKHTSLSFDLEHVLEQNIRSELLDKFFGDMPDNFVYGPKLDDQIDAIERLGLTDQNFVADCDKGFFWTRVQMGNDDEAKAKAFDQLIAHLRNSLAHGRTAKEDDFLILEDIHTTSAKSSNLSARIVLNPSTLVEWVKSIEKAIRDFA